MFQKKADTALPIMDALAHRWSGRAYDEDRPVDQASLTKILEAARWTPSCFNEQPWRLVIFDRFQDPEAFEMALSCLVEANQTWAKAAPILMLAAAETLFGNGSSNRWASYDTGAAIMSLSIEATHLGLMVHQMGGFKAAEIKARLSIPDHVDCLTMIAIGYQLKKERIPEALISREEGERSRKPLSDLLFKGTWGDAQD